MKREGMASLQKSIAAKELEKKGEGLDLEAVIRIITPAAVQAL